jgi:hypothetical protein
MRLVSILPTIQEDSTRGGVAMSGKFHKIPVGICLGLVVTAGTTWLVSATTVYRHFAATNAAEPPAPDRTAMVKVLGSMTPNASLGEEAQTFDRLVGTWEADFTFPKPDGTVSRKKGELHFGWVMDGYAVQDLWIGYPTQGRQERSVGTTIRFYDAKLKQWRIVFIDPQFNYVVTTQGGREGDRIVLRGVDTDGLPIRWTFRDITPASFHWQGEKSHDGGKTWALEEDHHMTRRMGAQPTQNRTISEAAFKQLSALAGEWEAVQDGTPVRETYTVTASGSALFVETKPANEAAMITMVTVDGDRLIATHYCSAGNQPQMVTNAPGDLRKGLTFSLERITGLKTADDWHNTGLTIILDDDNHMTQHWTYLYKGRAGTTHFHYTRRR